MLRLTTGLMVLTAVLGTGGAKTAFAQEDFDVYNSEQIDVDGLYKERPKPTASDRTRQKAQKLKKQTDERIDNTIENMRLEEEKRIGKRLENMFKGKGLADGDSAAHQGDSVMGARPAAVKKQQTTSNDSDYHSDKTVSIAVLGGFNHMSLPNSNRFSTNNYSGEGVFVLELSGFVTPRIDVGIGISHASLSFEENPTYVGYSYGAQYTTPYPPYNGREISGRIISADLRGRFYFTTGKIRPFICGGLGFNRLSLEYRRGVNGLGNYDRPFYDNYGREGYVSSYMDASAGIGMIIQFNNNFGLLAQSRFSRNFDFDKNSSKDQDFRYQSGVGGGPGYINDQVVLENLGGQVKDSTQINVTLGIISSF